MLPNCKEVVIGLSIKALVYINQNPLQTINSLQEGVMSTKLTKIAAIFRGNVLSRLLFFISLDKRQEQTLRQNRWRLYEVHHDSHSRPNSPSTSTMFFLIMDFRTLSSWQINRVGSFRNPLFFNKAVNVSCVRSFYVQIYFLIFKRYVLQPLQAKKSKQFHGIHGILADSTNNISYSQLVPNPAPNENKSRQIPKSSTVQITW